MDGTLIRTDLLWESLFQFIKQHPTLIFMLPLWFLRGGKAQFKARIAERVSIDPATLPYSEPVLEYLREEHTAGRELVLATGSNERHARAVAEHVGLFDRVFASDDETNLSGEGKRDRLVEVFGEGGFAYVGNDRVDLAIWSHAAEGILVDPLADVEREAREMDKAQKVLRNEGGGLQAVLKAMRVHQWMKNLLLFVPLILAHRFAEPVLIAEAVLAFIVFGLCASSVYLLNDLLDLPADRKHPRKRRRPFAAGHLSIPSGVALLVGLLIVALTLALVFLPLPFLLVLGLYYATTVSYSFKLKQIALVDVLVLATLYTLRILAGSAAVEVEASFWLLAFSMFFFMSLALVKRYSELLLMKMEGKEKTAGRGYNAIDMETLSQFGSASGYLAVLVLALYISSEEVRLLYQHPEAIWLLCPLVLYWISRVWLLTRRDEMHEDPIVFAIEDRQSHFIAVISLVVLWAAL